MILPEPYDYGEPDKALPARADPHPRRLLTMLATTLDETSSPARVGDEGVLQRPFRSFRFGA